MSKNEKSVGKTVNELIVMSIYGDISNSIISITLACLSTAVWQF